MLTQCPVVALAFPTTFARDLHEALVQAQVVSDAVLPALLVLFKVRELGRDELIDLGQSCSLCRRVLDAHGDQGHVTVRWLCSRISIRGITRVISSCGGGISCS